MAGLIRILSIVLLFSAGASLAAAPAPERLSYSLRPSFEGDSLTSVVVEIAFTSPTGSRTVFKLPGEWADGAERWRYLGGFAVDGGRLVDGPTAATKIVVAPPGGSVTLRYRVDTAYKKDPGAGGNPYAGAAIRPRWFASLGQFLFAAPEDKSRPATFSWRGWPSDWKTALTLDSAGPARTVSSLMDSSLLAAPDLEIRRRNIEGGTLLFASRGRWKFNLDEHADKTATILSAQRRSWRAPAGPYAVTLFELATDAGSVTVGGTGLIDGFAEYATSNADERLFLRTIAHEHLHNWIALRLGEAPDAADEAKIYWLSEGFTEFYTGKSLVGAGVWSLEAYVEDLNAILFEYASSPARSAPNDQAASRSWTEPPFGRLPYLRGHLLALVADHQIEISTKGRSGLKNVMTEMQRGWLAAKRPKPDLVPAFIAASRSQGFDPRALIQLHVEKGQPITLPTDLFGACASVVTQKVPAFDPGFDRQASADTGVIAGVDPHAAAYAAGLRDGMKRINRLSGREGDARVPMGYRVSDASGERDIIWLPAGRSMIEVQQVILAANLREDMQGRCRARMSS